MLKKLKRSFVTVTMLSAALVLAVLMGLVNLANYIERTGTDREILTFLAENGGRFPQGKNNGDGLRGSPEPGASPESASAEPSFSPEQETALRELRGLGRHMTAETPYETRFFTVRLTTEGQVAAVDTGQVAAVTGEQAAARAQALWQEGKTDGRWENYRFVSVAERNGVLYIFLDCTRNITAVRAFLLNSAVVTAAGLLVLFGLAWLLAGRAVRPIAESYEKQKAFITNAGHELKTPLAVIQSSAEVIELESGENRWTQSIRRQVERLSGLVADLVSLARMDEEAARPALTEQDISPVVAEALEPFRDLAERDGLVFEASITPDLRLPADRASLEKLCGILADNAVKYCAPGGTIRFTLAREGGHVVLREENPAAGLERGRQEKLFQRFYRGDASHSSRQPGYGLGLPLARSLAEAMGGRLTAESPDGERLVVTARLS